MILFIAKQFIDYLSEFMGRVDELNAPRHDQLYEV